MTTSDFLTNNIAQISSSPSFSYYTANVNNNPRTWKVAQLNIKNEAILTMLASEKILAQEWNTPEEDEQWVDL